MTSLSRANYLCQIKSPVKRVHFRFGCFTVRYREENALLSAHPITFEQERKEEEL